MVKSFLKFIKKHNIIQISRLWYGKTCGERRLFNDSVWLGSEFFFSEAALQKCSQKKAVLEIPKIPWKTFIIEFINRCRQWAYVSTEIELHSMSHREFSSSYFAENLQLINLPFLFQLLPSAKFITHYYFKLSLKTLFNYNFVHVIQYLLCNIYWYWILNKWAVTQIWI